LKYRDSYEFPTKTFYWCSPKNDMVFERMPEPCDHWRETVDKNAGKPFSGDPTKVLKKGK